MIARFFDWLEGFTDPLPPAQPEMPPADLIPFMVHYARPFWKLLLVAACFSAVIAVLEVSLFAFLGRMVDWLATSTRATFWADHGGQLVLMGVVLLVILPVLKFLYESVSHQGLLGNFAMRTRWQAHRYLLRQSMEFYQDDFAWRVAAKMMQTALAVRDIVMKMAEVMVYIVVYFTAAVVLFAASDIRLTAPMLIWLVGYVIAMRYFVPRLRDWSKAQAEARSVVTGRVVDSYTNIGTVKMFAHAAIGPREFKLSESEIACSIGLVTVRRGSDNETVIQRYPGHAVFNGPVVAWTATPIDGEQALRRQFNLPDRFAFGNVAPPPDFRFIVNVAYT